MSKNNFKRQWAEGYLGSPHHPGDEPSMTVPDQSLSIRQLLLNHTKGIDSQIREMQGEYYDTEIPRIDDLNDLAEYREALTNRINEVDGHVQALREEKKKKMAQDAAKKKSAPDGAVNGPDGPGNPSPAHAGTQ